MFSKDNPHHKHPMRMDEDKIAAILEEKHAASGSPERAALNDVWKKQREVGLSKVLLSVMGESLPSQAKEAVDWLIEVEDAKAAMIKRDYLAGGGDSQETRSADETEKVIGQFVAKVLQQLTHTRNAHLKRADVELFHGDERGDPELIGSGRTQIKIAMMEIDRLIDNLQSLLSSHDEGE